LGARFLVVLSSQAYIIVHFVARWASNTAGMAPTERTMIERIELGGEEECGLPVELSHVEWAHFHKLLLSSASRDATASRGDAEAPAPPAAASQGGGGDPAPPPAGEDAGDVDATGLCPYIGGRVLASVLARHGAALRGCSVVELGCGVGLYGVIAARHAAHVVLTDGDEVCARAPLWCALARRRGGGRTLERATRWKNLAARPARSGKRSRDGAARRKDLIARHSLLDRSDGVEPMMGNHHRCDALCSRERPLV